MKLHHDVPIPVAPNLNRNWGGGIHILVARDAKTENVDLAPELELIVHFLAEYSIKC